MPTAGAPPGSPSSQDHRHARGWPSDRGQGLGHCPRNPVTICSAEIFERKREAGAVATASAGFANDYPNGPLVTALLAGVTTVFASLEKVLKLREKWDLHRNIQVALEMISLRASAGLIDTRETVELIETTALTYSVRLADLNAAGGDSPGLNTHRDNG